MSKKRDIQLDIENTKRKLKKLPVPTNSKKNWLGHGDGGAVIDEMLLKGVTLQELTRRQKQLIQEEGKGRKDEKSVRSHIDHLRDAHGLFIHKLNGIYKFDYPTTSKKEELEDAFSTKNEEVKDTERKAMVSQRIGQNILRKELL